MYAMVCLPVITKQVAVHKAKQQQQNQRNGLEQTRALGNETALGNIGQLPFA